MILSVRLLDCVRWLLVAVTFCVAAQAQADVTYRYVGARFNAFQDDTPPAGSYDASMGVEVSLTFAQPLPANVYLQDFKAEVLAFSFKDGRHVVTDGELMRVEFSTDAQGIISDWGVRVVSPSAPPASAGEQQVDIGSLKTNAEWGVVMECVSEPCGILTDVGQAVGARGTWQETIVSLPPPVPALPPLGVALLAGALAALGRRFAQRR